MRDCIRILFENLPYIHYISLNPKPYSLNPKPKPWNLHGGCATTLPKLIWNAKRGLTKGPIWALTVSLGGEYVHQLLEPY